MLMAGESDDDDSSPEFNDITKHGYRGPLHEPTRYWILGGGLNHYPRGQYIACTDRGYPGTNKLVATTADCSAQCDIMLKVKIEEYLWDKKPLELIEELE